MNIFNNLIKTSEIIGIGPLYVQASKDSAMRQLYNQQRYVFNVHTLTNSIEIFSDYFQPGTNDYPDKNQREKMKKWENEYYNHRRKIEELIGETQTA